MGFAPAFGTLGAEVKGFVFIAAVYGAKRVFLKTFPVLSNPDKVFGHNPGRWHG